MNDDIKVDPKTGELQLLDGEKAIAENISKLLRKDLESNFIGIPVKEVNKDAVYAAVKNTCKDVMGSLSGVKNLNKIDACILWSRMSSFQKAKWFLYNKFPLKWFGDRYRKEYDKMNEDLRDSLGENVWTSPIPYPDYLQLSPKSIVIVAANIQLAQPMEYIVVDLKIDGEKE